MEIKSYIPKECFKKQPLWGTFYMAFDFFLWLLCVFMYYSAEDRWWLIKILYWFTSGFFMWCQFMHGHDCGHGSFSDSPLLNKIMGHVSHTPLLVPFNTWAESHRRHHLGHNHIDRDYSHPHTVNSVEKLWLLKAIRYTSTYPIIGWFSYLLGLTDDGGHWIPFGGRLWNIDYQYSKQLNSLFSSFLVFSFFYGIIALCEFDIVTFLEWYGMSWIIFSWWVVTVTFLQHHDNTVEQTILYDDAHWTFMKGALQTVDRSYGGMIDTMTHHITNGHIVHHLFFTSIPHYHLEKATHYLYEYFNTNNIDYKYRYTPFFFLTKYINIHLQNIKYKK
jgi:omega-3 fatty acid desaturase (delta-15 desaturase)